MHYNYEKNSNYKKRRNSRIKNWYVPLILFIIIGDIVCHKY